MKINIVNKDGQDIDFKTAEHLPRVGETVNCWSMKSKKEISGKVMSVHHNFLDGKIVITLDTKES